MNSQFVHLSLFLSIILISVQITCGYHLNPSTDSDDWGPEWLDEYHTDGSVLDLLNSEAFVNSDHYSQKRTTFGRAHFRPGKRNHLELLRLDADPDDDRWKRSIAFGRSGFRPAKRSIDDQTWNPYNREPSKKSVVSGRAHFRPGKKSIDEELWSPYLPSFKRSVVSGRAHFRPGKKSIDEELWSPYLPSFKRSVVSGRAHFRPAKKSTDDEAWNPYQLSSKRSVVSGRGHFRPAKRFPEFPTAAAESENLNQSK